MTTVRLPNDIEQKLDSLSASKHKTKSEIIKEALELLFSKEDVEKDSYELGKDLFGKFGSGSSNLSVDYKSILKEKLHVKYNTH